MIERPDSHELIVLFAGGMMALVVAAVSGLILMYRQVGELKVELNHLSRAIEDMTQAARDERAASRDEIRRLHERIDSLRGSRQEES
jgi:hypothetical protein